MLQLEDNPSLRGLDALERAGELIIQGNGPLPRCEVDRLSRRITLERPLPLGGHVNRPPRACAP